MCCPFAHGYRAIHWSMINLPGAMPLKKTYSPIPSLETINYQELLAGRDSCFPSHTGMLASWPSLRSYAGSHSGCEITLQQPWHAPSSPPWPLALTIFLRPLLQWSLRLLGGQVWHRWSICSWALQWHLFYGLRVVANFSINHHSLHKNPSLVRFESCTSLPAPRYNFVEKFATMPF